MDLRLVRTFVAAAERLNFRRAAEQLFLSQPTVTKHIRQLEGELGFELFHRRGRRISLTPAGERFVAHARRVLAAHDAAMEDMAGWARGYTTRLTVAVSPLVGSSTLPWLLRRFTGQHPGVEVVVRVVLSPEVAPAVIRGDAQLGLSRLPPSDSRLAGRVLYTDPVLLVAAQDNADPDGPVPDWEQLLAENRLFAYNHPGYWPPLLHALRRRGLRPRTMSVTQVDVTKRLIEEGLGVSFLPQSAVRRELVEGRLLEVPTPGFPLPEAATYLILPQRLPPPARAFVDVIDQVFPPPGPDRPLQPAPGPPIQRGGGPWAPGGLSGD
ncbi:MAG: LysR family transcriptional regulator [Firmicutes bacterium]|nr:LysR family transcriptional regulator [Bacillota bacterium]